MQACKAEMPGDFSQNPALLACAEDWSVLTAIYQPQVQLAVLQHPVLADPELLTEAVASLLAQPGSPDFKLLDTPQGIALNLGKALEKTSLKTPATQAFIQALLTLCEAFSTLFDSKNVALRIVRLQSAMCPKFHVDRIPVRLICTFAGPATQWLTDDNCDRSQLGGRGDACRDWQFIRQLTAGDVALMKGDGWEGNEGCGLVHRSPDVKDGERRLVLTLDLG
ncbi:DUF1826 domain-containing protein [Thalassolituus sp. LLYu03]|uniref:DUF1826 domain-containing protein n=1 Tax=Thalassolituus sp. LLYu03 TaxID=3421656 RepID=UPI003D2E3FA1